MAQYQILGKLGGGGMGVVYTARDLKLGRRVALKFLPPQWSHDEDAKQRFIREAQAASATDHPNICTIHDIETAPDGRLFIVMAQYDGPTLKQRLEQGPMRPDEAIDIAAQIAEGLARAHAQGVVHRDVKPGNLILTEDGVRIVDFGLARFAGSLQLTLDGSTLGTVTYMSPEQSRGDDADTRSDVWSIGVVLYEMLSGERPFKGGYTEAIANAIRTEPTPSLPKHGGDGLEAVERVIRRALEKDPRQRYQNAREMARDLRLLQGRPLPIDLLTGALTVTAEDRKRRRRRSWLRPLVAAGGLAVLLLAGGAWLVLSPIDRVPIVIAPVVNQTGYPELDAYRMALTQELIGQLADSRFVKVPSYERLLAQTRPFRATGQDVSSRDALQAISAAGTRSVVVVPTLLYENGAWRGRVEFRDPGTAINEAAIDTAAVVSSLVKDATYGLIPDVARTIDAHFLETGGYRRRLISRVRGYFAAPAVRRPQFKSLDAAMQFEQGVSALEQFEFATALGAFSQAADIDSDNPRASAWRSRVAWLMRQDGVAIEAGDHAVRSLTQATSPGLRTFTQAVAAEAHRDPATAATQYRLFVAGDPADAQRLIELGGFQDRIASNRDAIDTYRQALAIDDTLLRPRLELCRLYNRVNESANAKTHAQRLLAGARALRDWAFESQALFCLADVLRVGTPAERAQSRDYAKAALNLLTANSADYQLARAHYYAGLSASSAGDLTEGLREWQLALDGARRQGNLLLEPLLLMNIGALEGILGNHANAADAYQESLKGYERLGDNARAAQLQANRGGLLIEYGDRPDEGRRDIENALAVVRKLADKNFEVFCLQLIAAHDRNSGRHADAIRTLNQALAIARERDLKDDVSSLTIDLARSHFDLADYIGARTLFVEALGGGAVPLATEGRVRLALTRLRLDDPAAKEDLDQAAKAISGGGARSGLVSLVHFVAGQLAIKERRPTQARDEFEQAVSSVGDELDATAIAARIELGALDLSEGRLGSAKLTLAAALKQAIQMDRYGLAASARLQLARVANREQRFDQALALLQPIPPDGKQAIGPELQAQIHRARADALEAKGDTSGSATEAFTAVKLAGEVRKSAEIR